MNLLRRLPFIRPSIQVTAGAGRLREYNAGLLPIYIGLRNRTREAQKGQISIRVDGDPRGARYRFDRVLSPGHRQDQVILVSHLLPDGAYQVLVEWTDAQQQVLDRVTLTIRFANKGPLAAQVRDHLIARQTPLVLDPPCDSTHFGPTGLDLAPWYDRPDALAVIETRLECGQVTNEEAQLLRQFVTEGYVILDKSVSAAAIDPFVADLEHAIQTGYQGYQPGSSARMELLHFTYPSVKRLLYQRPAMDFLEMLWGVKPRPCQSLVFAFGSQQDAHQDTIHLTPYPAGYMCGVWTALEDIQPNSGELVVYPGSHRLKRLTMADADCAKVQGDWTEFGAKIVPVWQAALEGAFKPVIYRPRKGQVLIWHENLMHGGSPRLDPSISRRSLVVHYFAEGSLVYYDSTGRIGSMLAADENWDHPI
jgi:hypothetical protein